MLPTANWRTPQVIPQMPPSQAAFSLLELVVVIVIIGIIAIVAAPRFSTTTDFQSRSVAAELVSRLRFAQQLAMNNTSQQVTAVIGANSIDIRVNSGSGAISLTDYPFVFADQSDVALAPASSLTFDSLGNTNPITITLTPSAGVSVCVASTGFAYLC